MRSVEVFGLPRADGETLRYTAAGSLGEALLSSP
jgi:hypothetical protein